MRETGKAWDVVVLGGANSDYLVRGKCLPKPGETADGREFMEAPGGKGANQAVAAARLGARVAFIGKVGTDRRGAELIESLKAEGIDTHYVFRESRAATGAAVIMVDAKGEKQILSAPGANHKLTLAECEKAARMIRACRVLLVQFETPVPVVLRAVERGRSAGAIVVLDPAPPRRVPKRLLSCVDVIRPNSTEAKALTGIKVVDRKSAVRAARWLFAAGVRRAVAIQAGSQGDLLIGRETPDDPILLAPMKVKTIDETGAGDAFAAGLAVALAWEQPYSIAGPFASAAAALTTTKFGAQPAMPRLRDVLRLMRRNGFVDAAEAIDEARHRETK